MNTTKMHVVFIDNLGHIWQHGLVCVVEPIASTGDGCSDRIASLTLVALIERLVASGIDGDDGGVGLLGSDGSGDVGYGRSGSRRPRRL